MPFRLSLAQINPTVGDLTGNAAKILDFARRAAPLRPDLVLFPELALTGYPPEDLLLHGPFLKAAARTLQTLARDFPPGLAAVAGCPEGAPGRLFNAAAVISGGKVRAFYRKQLLPNYGVFDERRYFVPGRDPLLLKSGGALAGVTVCEDIWTAGGPALQAARKGASLILNISSSPYHAGKLDQREKLLRARARESRAHVAYCNLAGGQDELVFDGASFVVDPRGRVLARAPQFQEALLTLDLDLPPARKPARAAFSLPSPSAPRPAVPPAVASPLAELDEIHAALVLGTRDYLRKNGFQKAVVGLSGGIDSSLVACVAADALGRENVVGVTLPSKFNAPETRSDAETLARNLGLAFHSIPIQAVVEKFLEALAPLFAGKPADITEENLQSRVRGVLLMALSNKFGWMVLTTGNKSETSVGYSTLYGDTAGGFAVIKDIPKNLVYRLARRVNERAGREIIPRSVFDRPPTAELRPNQTDQDSLPPYDALDKIVELAVEGDKGLAEILKAGADETAARRVLRLIAAAEHKRRQAPPGVKITPKAFGRDRRMPVTNKYIEDFGSRIAERQ
ncbi:MAG: NAD+ synthase [Elusimicrobiota bacterium]